MQLEELFTVATFDDRPRAETLQHRLDHAGIPSQVFNERPLQRFFLFSKPRSGFRVRVEKQNAIRAQEMIKEWHATDHILDGAVCCPECGSYTVEYPQFSRKTLQSMFFAMLSALRFLPKQYYCESCQFTWSPEPPEKGPELDILNWPIKRTAKR